MDRIAARIAAAFLAASLPAAAPAGSAPSAEPARPAGASTASPSPAVRSTFATARDFLPPQAPDVEPTGACALYAGEHLFDYIDGAAPQYFEYGFVEVAAQEILFSGRAYFVDAYLMAGPDAAFGIFSARRPDGASRIEGFPESAVLDNLGLVADGACLAEIQARDLSAETAGDIREIARRVFARSGSAPAARAAPVRDLLARWPQAGIVPGTERWARGQTSLAAALGRDAGGLFGRVLDTLAAVVHPEAAGADHRPAPAAPSWMVARYHADAQEEPGTLAVLLAGARDPARCAEAARAVASGAAPAPLGADRGWIARGAADSWCLAAAIGGDILVATSRLSPDSLQGWVEEIARR
jgi:hypothetical protein